jgi:hypothetical protein
VGFATKEQGCWLGLANVADSVDYWEGREVCSFAVEDLAKGSLSGRETAMEMLRLRLWMIRSS